MIDRSARAEAVAQQPAPKLHHRLLDLPHLLSLDGFEASLWSRLPRPARFSLKRTCRQGKQLVESLTCSGSLNPARQRLTRQALRQAVASHVAVVPRLPRLTSLALHRCWPNEVELVGVLAQYGAASAGRITQLTLSDEQLSHAAVLAIAGAFPRLERLTLQGAHGCRQEHGLKLHGALFLPLHGGRLTKLSLQSCIISPDAVASLAGLTDLEFLQVDSLHATPTAGLHYLSSLCGLRHCDIAVPEPVTLVDASALFSATGLTSLRISDVRGNGPVGSAHLAAEVAAALEQLAGLVSLQSLDLGSEYVVDDATLATLGRLPHLTRLCIAGIATAAAPMPGHLPRLETLHLGSEDEALDLSRLLQTLLPLLPLPALTTLVEGHLTLDMGCDTPDDPNALGDGDAAAAAAAAAIVVAQVAVRQTHLLRTIMSHLAAAPCLHKDPCLMLSGEVSWRNLTLDQIVSSLRPLGAGLLTLATWGEVELGGTDRACVHQCLPGLTELRLDGSNSSGWDVPAMVHHLPGVTRLELYLSEAASGDQAMWLRLAEECDRRINFDTELPEETAVLCRELQERVHGAVLMNW